MKADSKKLAAEIGYLKAALVKTSIPSLRCVMVDAAEGQAVLRMAGFDTFLKATIECEAKTPAKFLIDHAWLLEMCLGEEIEITPRLDGLTVQMRAGANQSSVPLHPVKDWAVEWPDLGDRSASLDLDSTLATNAVKHVSEVVSEDPQRYVFHSPWLLQDGSIVATDGKAFARIPLGVPGPPVPASFWTAGPWTGLAASGYDRLKLDIYDRWVQAVCGHREMIYKQLDGTPPSMRTVAGGAWGEGDSARKWATVDRKQLSDRLKALDKYAEIPGGESALWTFGEGGLILTHTTNDAGERTFHVEASGTLEPFVLATPLTLQTLAALPDGDLRVGSEDGLTPVIFAVDKAGEAVGPRVVQMPVRRS